MFAVRTLGHRRGNPLGCYSIVWSKADVVKLNIPVFFVESSQEEKKEFRVTKVGRESLNSIGGRPVQFSDTFIRPFLRKGDGGHCEPSGDGVFWNRYTER